MEPASLHSCWQKNNFLLLIEFKTSLHGRFVALSSLLLFLLFFFRINRIWCFMYDCVCGCVLLALFFFIRQKAQEHMNNTSKFFGLRFIQQFCSCSFGEMLIKWIQNTEEFQFYCKPHFTIHSIENWLQMNKQTNLSMHETAHARIHTHSHSRYVTLSVLRNMRTSIHAYSEMNQRKKLCVLIYEETKVST